MTRLILAVGILAASTDLVAENGPATTAAAKAPALKYSSSLPEAPPAQSDSATTTATQTTQTTSMSTRSTGPHDQPIFTMPFGASYTLANVNNTNGGPDTSFLGWYVAPTVQITRHIAARFDLEQDYDTHRNASNLHLLRATAGPEFTFPIPLLSKWTSPFVYAEGGDTRVRYPNYIQWEATAVGGFGVQVPITRRFGFQLIPGEYSTIKLDNGNWLGDYSAKAGFVLNLYGDR